MTEGFRRLSGRQRIRLAVLLIAGVLLVAILAFALRGTI